MSYQPICPFCAYDQCDHCTGPGCYCDCQIPSDGPHGEDIESIGEREEDERFMNEGYA